MNAIKKLLITLLVIIIILSTTICYAIFVAPNRLTYSTYDIYSSKIDEQLNDISILFFSDILYGEFVDENQLSQTIAMIDNYDADVIIFGGDIFSENAIVTNADIDLVKSYLASLDAPLGKFYVLGDIDYTNKDTIDSLLTNSGFESIENKIIHLRKHNNANINLIGFSNIVNGENNIDSLLNSLNPNTYTLAICHTPDIAKQITYGIDYLLAGDSLGGQVYFPFIGGLYASSGSTYYQHGTYSVNNFTLHISNGIGTSRINARLFAPAQLTILKLHHKD